MQTVRKVVKEVRRVCAWERGKEPSGGGGGTASRLGRGSWLGIWYLRLFSN